MAEYQDWRRGRRRIFKAALGTIGVIAAKSILKPEVRNSLDFGLGRESVSDQEVYIPRSPDIILSKEVTDRIFEKLKLSERFSETINKEAFNLIAQRPARLAGLYFRPDQEERNEETFANFCETFFGRMLEVSDQLKVDFIGTLLMFQISGANTPSAKVQRRDVWDERARVGMTVAKEVFGEKATSFSIGALRALGLGDYYNLPRLEGPVTIGIHDIEIVMIARALKSLEETYPEGWEKISKYLQERSPRFFGAYPSYVDLYQDFEAKSQAIAQEINDSPEIKNYIDKFYKRDFIRDFLRRGEGIDPYQFSKTTAFWAIVSEMRQTYMASFNDVHYKELEEQAFEKTVDYYLDQKRPSGFFLDQLTNPKMLKVLKEDALVGDFVAKRLLRLVVDFSKKGDEVIAKDRSLADALIDEQTEFDLEFQLVTGVAYARWVLNEAWKHSHDDYQENLKFGNPDDLAYNAFLANGLRESAPTYLLTASRPLHRATLTFLVPSTQFDTMDSFIAKVYQEFEEVEPRNDFKTFASYFMNLIEEAYLKHVLGTHRYRISGDRKMGEFIKAADEWGAYKKVITLPHDSWMRAFEATAGYISECS